MYGYYDGPGSFSWAQRMYDRMEPSSNPNWQEIPEELEPYEFWDAWKHDIDVIWPGEPDQSLPPSREA